MNNPLAVFDKSMEELDLIYDSQSENEHDEEPEDHENQMADQKESKLSKLLSAVKFFLNRFRA